MKRSLASLFLCFCLAVCPAAVAEIPQIAFQGFEPAPVRSVAGSPDGKLVAAAYQDRSVRVWDALTGAIQFVLATPSTAAACVAFDPRGDQIASGNEDGTVSLWSVADGSLSRTLVGDPAAVSCLAFSSGGEFLAVGCADGKVGLWQPDSGSRISGFDGGAGGITSISFDAEGRFLVAGTTYGLLLLLDTSSGTLQGREEAHSGGALCVAFSPDSKKGLVSGGADGALIGWSIYRGPQKASLMGSWRMQAEIQRTEGSGNAEKPSPYLPYGNITSAAFSPDGALLATGGQDGRIMVWDARSRDHPAWRTTLTGHAGTATSICFGRDSSILLSGGHDGAVKVWDLRGIGQPPLTVVADHRSDPECLAFSAKGDLLASGDPAGGISVYDIAARKVLRTLRAPPVSDRIAGSADWLSFSPDGRLLACISVTDVVVWDLAVGVQLSKFTYPGARPICVRFDGDGGLSLLGASNGWTPEVWKGSPRDKSRWRLVKSLSYGNVPYGAWSASGNAIALSGLDSRDVSVVDAVNGKELARTPQQPGDLRTSLSEDGRILATWGDNLGVKLWAVPGAKPIADGGGFGWGGPGGQGVALQPTRKLLATSESMGRTWDIARGMLSWEAPFEYQSSAQSVAFSPDGSLLAVAAGKGVRLWAVAHEAVTLVAVNQSDSVAFTNDGYFASSAGAKKCVSCVSAGFARGGVDLSDRFRSPQTVAARLLDLLGGGN